ncbi:hypothetical protein JHE00_11955 [Prauserella sp. ASG 168]|uniref:YggT family protein n=1 Tax=Prauserella cavernicola TaxID=2800127 RepID=A0A934QRI4_9PSEU|nr:hypothetical protein [Prauserella cavernicola]
MPPGPAVSTYRNAAEEPESAPKRTTDWRLVRDRVVGLLAGIVRWIGLLFALVLVLHVIFVIGEANAGNGIVSWVSDWSESLSLGFKDLFQPEDPKLSVLVNYGIAAVFWLVVSSIVARVIRRVGGSA